MFEWLCLQINYSYWSLTNDDDMVINKNNSFDDIYLSSSSIVNIYTCICIFIYINIFIYMFIYIHKYI